VAPEENPKSAPNTPLSNGVQRLLTGLAGIVGALVAVFFLPTAVFFGLMLLIFALAAWEYTQIVRRLAPSAPLASLLVWMPLAAVAGYWLLELGEPAEPQGLALVAAAALVVLGPASTVLFAGRAREQEALVAIGALAFGIPYFALPAICAARLHALDPWFVVLLLLIVWVSDTAAFYVGSRLGRHKLAPVVSPNKSWEGAAAGFALGVVAALVWSWLHLEKIEPGIVAVAAMTAVAAQVGDLVESIIKRGAGVKDSSQLLPGHGGVFDRMDAMLFAAPVFLLGLWFFRLGDVLPG